MSTWNVDPHVAAVEGDVVDLADPDAGDAHLVVGLQAAGLGEGGVVGVAAADQRQVVGLNAARISSGEHGEADRPDR